jgi:hypothetical protein
MRVRVFVIMKGGLFLFYNFVLQQQPRNYSIDMLWSLISVQFLSSFCCI